MTPSERHNLQALLDALPRCAHWRHRGHAPPATVRVDDVRGVLCDGCATDLAPLQARDLPSARIVREAERLLAEEDAAAARWERARRQR